MKNYCVEWKCSKKPKEEQGLCLLLPENVFFLQQSKAVKIAV